jgi:pimeloyl-ACP methyl ester carboxylesterase
MIVLPMVAPSLAAGAAVESFIEAPGPLGPLKGTMLSPQSPGVPVALIIPGSGPTDRDGNNTLGLKASSYRLMAEGLAADGVATVRIDKRGMYASRAAVADANAVTIADYAADIHSWATTIRQQTGAPCVWLLGHSEGALVALVASQDAPDICGLILAAGAGRPLAQVLREQLKANPANAPLLGQAFTAIDALEAGKHPDTANMNPLLLPLFKPQVQDFLMNAFSYDPAALLAHNAKPVLILQGQRDLQVSVADAQRLKAANPQAKLVLLPDANHMFKSVPSDSMAANFATYGNPDLPLAPNVTHTIADFIISGGKGR